MSSLSHLSQRLERVVASPLGARLLLLVMAAATLGFDLWAVLVDRRPSGGDTFTNTTLHLHDHLRTVSPWAFTQTDGPKGPVAPLLALPFLVLLERVPLATRLVSVLCHTALVVQSYDLGRLLSGSRAAGLWAAALLATSPMVFGWGRLDFHEVPLAAVVTGSLQLMMRVKLDRILPALALGALMGVGILTKLGYVVFMVAPGVWFVLARLRGVRSGLYLLLMLGAMAAVAQGWVRGNLDVIMGNYHMTTSFREPWTDKALAYVSDPPTYLLLAVGLVSAGLGAWRRWASRWDLVLLVSFIGVSLWQFAVLFDYWTRYTVPLYPAASALAALGLSRLLAWAPRWPARVVAAALGVALWVPYVQHNLHEVVGANAREFTFGMSFPDPRPYDGFPRAMRALQPYGDKFLLFVEPGPAHTRWAGMEQIWRFRGVRMDKLDPGHFMKHQRAGRRLAVLFIRDQAQHGMNPGRYPGKCPPLWPEGDPGRPKPAEVAWLQGQRSLRCLYTAVDPDGIAYIAYGVQSTVPVQIDDAPPPPPRTQKNQ